MTESVVLPPDRSGAMPDYRAYVVGDDGHFVNFEGFACRDDDEALAQAKRLVDGHDVGALERRTLREAEPLK